LLFWADAATSLIFAALVYRRVPESRPTARERPRGWEHLARDRRLLGFALAHLSFVVVWWQFQFAVPIVMQRQGLPPLAFGLLLGTNCVYLLILLPLAVPRIAKLDQGRVLSVASLLVGVGYGAYAFCATIPQYLLATVVWSTGELFGMPAASAVVAQLAPAELRGEHIEKSKRLFFGKAVVTGGLMMTKTTERTVRTSEEATTQLELTGLGTLQPSRTAGLQTPVVHGQNIQRAVDRCLRQEFD